MSCNDCREFSGLRIDETPTAVTRVDSKHTNASALYKSEDAVDASLSLFSVLTESFVCFVVCGALDLHGLAWRAVFSPTRLRMPQHSAIAQLGNSRGAVNKSEHNAMQTLGNIRFNRLQ